MIKACVPAKVNLTLCINGVTDGYHDLSSIVASADIYDTVWAEEASSDHISSEIHPSTTSKIVTTIEAMRKDYGFGGVKISVSENIPVGGGLGGSSAVIAGVIRAVDALFELKLSSEKLTQYADLTGSDNAFMLFGGTGKIRGRSTVSDRFALGKTEAVIAVKGFCDTSEVFRLFDVSPDFEGCDEDGVIRAISNGNIDELMRLKKNVLTPFSVKLNPSIGLALESLSCSFMSGSGSSVIALGKNDADVLAKLEQNGYKIIRTSIGSYSTVVEKI